jgi:hypothetical protein
MRSSGTFAAAASTWNTHATPAPTTDFRSGCRVCLLRCGLCGIQFTVTLLDPSGTEVALHCDADMVRAIVGAR